MSLFLQKWMNELRVEKTKARKDDRLYLKGSSEWLNAHNNHIGEVRSKANVLSFTVSRGKNFYFPIFLSFFRKFFFHIEGNTHSFTLISLLTFPKKNLSSYFSCLFLVRQGVVGKRRRRSSESFLLRVVWRWKVERMNYWDIKGVEKKEWEKLIIYFCCWQMHQRHPPWLPFR